MADLSGPGVVAGTENDDTINGGYTDGDGDSVTSGNDVVFGLGGDDSIEAGDGNDTIHGDSGASGSGSSTKVIDFNDLAAGTLVSDQYAGVSIESYHSGTPTMIFDTSNPTGGDTDLATNNLGGVLILSEDGDSSDPDDNSDGGKMVFNFDDPVDVNQLTFLDIDEDYVKVKFYDANGDKIGEVKTYGGDDNSQIIQDYDMTGVSKMVVEMKSSGAIDNLTYTSDAPSGPGDFGDDVIFGEGGEDLIYGEGGSDTIDGGTGDDTIYGGYGDQEAGGTRESFNWSELTEGGSTVSDGDDPTSGQTQDTGSVEVTYTVLEYDHGKPRFEDDTQNVGGIDDGSETIDSSSSLESRTDDDGDKDVVQLEFSSAVSNVDFRVNDIDHDSVVTILAFDADGNAIPVTLTASGNTDLDLEDTDSVAGDDTARATGNSGSNTEDDNSILVEIAGPVATIQIIHENDGGDNSNVNITDVFYDTPVVSLDGLDEGDLILGGEGDDLIFGEEGDDTIYGQDGSDTVEGQDGDDIIYGGSGDGIPTTSHEIFEWSEETDFADGQDVSGFTQDTGSANITFSTVSQSSGVDTEYDTSTQDVSELDAEVGANSSLVSVLNDDANSATYAWASDTPIENVEFRINDIDGDGRVVVRAWDENDNPIEVVLTDAGSGLALSDADGVAGAETATSIDNDYTDNDNPEHSVLVTIPGPVSRWEVQHEQDGGNNSGVTVTDITFDVTTIVTDTDDGAGDSLVGGDGDDSIYGEGGDDTIEGGDGSDSIEGGEGNDLIESGTGDLADQLPDLGFPGYGPVPPIAADSDPDDDRDYVDGGAGNDTISTGDDADTILGGTGNDEIDGGVDADDIDGGEGDDTIIGGEGSDTIDGGDDDDLIYGGLDPIFPDSLNIKDDDDTFGPDPEPDNGRDLIDGGAGNDTIFGQDDDDTIFGGTGNDWIDAGIDDDSVDGGSGVDIISGDHGDDTLSGGDDTDLVLGGIGDDDISGDAGRDILGGGEGSDTVDAGTDSDFVYGGDGADSVIGGDGSDVVAGGEGDDEIYGDGTTDEGNTAGGAADLLFGGEGEDTLVGGSGDDILVGGADADDMSGGDDRDVFVEVGVGDHVDGGEGGDDYDTLVINGNAIIEYDESDPTWDGVTSESGTITYFDLTTLITIGSSTFENVENVIYVEDLPNPEEFLQSLTSGDDVPTVLATSASDVFEPTSGPGVVEGTPGPDLIDEFYAGDPDGDVVGPGDDTILGFDGNDTIEGLAGDDDIIAGDGDDVVDGGDDNDIIRGEGGNDSLEGGDGFDQISGGDDNDTIDGGADSDVLDGGDGDDSITGGTGNDGLYGNTGDDFLDGGDGSDLVVGGAGDDTIELGGDDGDIDLAFGNNDQDTFQNLGGGDTVIGGEGGDDFDTINLDGSIPPGGSYVVNYDAGDPTFDPVTGKSESGTITLLDSNGDPAGTITFGQIENIVCFTPGTVILTTSGEVPVEQLKAGDQVVTRDNGLQTIRWVGSKALSGRNLLQRPNLRPVMIRKGSLGPNLPERDMMVSPNHRMLMVSHQAQLLFAESEVLTAAKHMTHLDGVHQVQVGGVEYVHFLCDNHEVVLANGTWSESFQPGAFSMGSMDDAQRSEIYDLFPELQDHKGLDNYTSARLTLKAHEAKLLG
ncbi:Hint domain-containing protein [uncultured Shimia sp.]|uniref:Hint domain-containing protein n=1 Tax=uncultured Shimia sp. TaxID=573152 RepID=UPI002611DD15|nr:Hint domain-containing protein [uncultured Shimia sp.]